LPPHDFPALKPRHLHDARLYADREDMAAGLQIPRGGIIAEVGVALGDFSKRLIAMLAPREFVAIDTFTLHRISTLWGRATADIFQGLDHRTYYQQTLGGYVATLTIREGLSHLMLDTFPERYFDLIYLDADHSYEAVRSDAEVAGRKVRPDGLVIFNDYILFDHVSGTPYGVVPAVNELVVSQGWRVVGLALHQQMYCDIALRPPLSAAGN
jgi:Methyltransferase domain